MFLVLSPCLQAVFVNSFAHLGGRERIDGMFLLMKVQNTFVPIQASSVNDSTSCVWHVIHQVFVPNMRNSARQFLVPVLNQITVGMVQLGQTFKLRCIVQSSGRELMFVRREDGIHGLSGNMQDESIRKQHVNEAHVVVVCQHFVHITLWSSS